MSTRDTMSRAAVPTASAGRGAALRGGKRTRRTSGGGSAGAPEDPRHRQGEGECQDEDECHGEQSAESDDLDEDEIEDEETSWIEMSASSRITSTERMAH